MGLPVLFREKKNLTVVLREVALLVRECWREDLEDREWESSAFCAPSTNLQSSRWSDSYLQPEWVEDTPGHPRTLGQKRCQKAGGGGRLLWPMSLILTSRHVMALLGNSSGHGALMGMRHRTIAPQSP